MLICVIDAAGKYIFGDTLATPTSNEFILNDAFVVEPVLFPNVDGSQVATRLVPHSLDPFSDGLTSNVHVNGLVWFEVLAGSGTQLFVERQRISLRAAKAGIQLTDRMPPN